MTKRSVYANDAGMASKFSARLAREMKRNDWSYADVAGKLGTSKSQVHDWVHGSHSPNLASLRRVADLLKCDLTELIDAA